MDLKHITAFDETKSMIAWCRDPRCRVCTTTLRRRLREDWEPQSAITTIAPRGKPSLSVTAFGETKPLAEWTRDPRCHVSETVLRFRLGRGWPAERAITKTTKTQLTPMAWLQRAHEEEAPPEEETQTALRIAWQETYAWQEEERRREEDRKARWETEREEREARGEAERAERKAREVHEENKRRERRRAAAIDSLGSIAEFLWEAGQEGDRREGIRIVVQATSGETPLVATLTIEQGTP